jgi:signal transduction histidine kinase
MFKNLQFKIFILILALTSLFSISFFIQQKTENKKIENILKSESIEQDTLLRRIIELKGKSLKSYNFDYSYWDALIEFTKTKDKKWAFENIISTMPTFDVDAVWIFDLNFNLYYSYNNLENDKRLNSPFDKEKLFKIVANKPFNHFYFQSNGKIFEVYTAPLQPGSDIKRVSSPLGYLFCARLWDEAYVNDIALLTESKIELQPYGTLQKEERYAIHNSFILYDIENHPLVQAGTTKESTDLIDMVDASQFQKYITIAFSFCIIAFLILFLYYYVTRPINLISMALETEDADLLNSINSIDNIYIKLSRLIKNFFVQKNELIDEIKLRTEIEDKLKRNQNELVAAKEKAEEMNRLKSSFLSNMSHELRTPMTAILGFGEILYNSLENPQDKEMAETILKGGKRLTKTLNQILDLSKIEAEKFNINLKPVRISDVIKESINLYKVFAKEKNLKISYEINDDIYAMLDLPSFEKVMSNLVHNAIVYTQKGGVTVKTTLDKCEDKEYLRIDVIDTGIGIPDDLQEIVFEPFRQASEGLNRQYEGTGLGLTITKRFVEMMNGTIEFKSKIGQGTTFTIRFPFLKNIQPDIEYNPEISNKIEETIKKDSIKGLLVEDDELSIKTIKYMLKDICNLDIVENGNDAIESAKKYSYTFILMDIGLKDMSGMEAVQIIRKIEGYENKPIVAVTAFSMVGDKEKFIDGGCSHYLSKPFQMEELIDMVKKFI